MGSFSLSNHLRAHRKRLSLSQHEVAFLLGCERSTKVCRYETFAREPNFRTAVALEVLFGCSLRELFPGLFQGISRTVAGRAGVLIRMQGKTNRRHDIKKREALAKIAKATAPRNEQRL